MHGSHIVLRLTQEIVFLLFSANGITVRVLSNFVNGKRAGFGSLLLVAVIMQRRRKMPPARRSRRPGGARYEESSYDDSQSESEDYSDDYDLSYSRDDSSRRMATPRENPPAERPNAVRRMRARRRRRKDRSEVSCCVKWVVFTQNVLFWIVGMLIFAVGIWAWTEKDTVNNLKRLTSVAVDPAFLLIVTGLVTFIIGFTGCVGALRENTFLLAAYAFLLGLILLGELILGVLGFVCREWLKNQSKEQLQVLIRDYREDEDAQDLVDWIQSRWLQCCGITSPGDWNNNIYFNCSSTSSPEACGVPFSCCRPEENTYANLQCGYGVRRKDDFSDKIYNKGCVDAAQSWLDQNLVIVAAVAVGVAVVQILGICFSQNLRADILAQKAKWTRYK